MGTAKVVVFLAPEEVGRMSETASASSASALRDSLQGVGMF